MISSSDIHRGKILIVDDQPANVAVLEQMLYGAGYRGVSFTTDPRTVRELHIRNKYDLILLDLQMPGMDGFQVMDALKDIEASGYLPVLVITAQPNQKLRALKAGARDFVSKPFDLTEVLTRVYNMLEIRLLHMSEASLSHARLENSQRIACLGDWEYDFADRRMIWSEEVYMILGITREDNPASPEALAKFIHPDDREIVSNAKARPGSGPHRTEYEHRIIRNDGEIRYLQRITEMTVDKEGRPARESGTIQDITDRKNSEGALRQSEERFKLVARTVSDVVWDRDLKANTLWWNDGFLATFGFSASEIEPSVESWASRVHPDERGRVVESIQHSLGSGAEAWTAEYRFRRRDGSYASVQDRGHIFRDAEGKGIRMVGGMRDLTEQKRIEAQNLRAQRMESIGTLAGGIAHDLNNVLAPIMMSIELLKIDSEDDPRRAKILDTILVSCSRGADLVRQVLSFALGLDGKRVAIRMKPLIEDLKGIITETFPRNIRIVSNVSPDLWPITGDPTQLHQVMINLAVNARDAMPAHGGTITISATNINIDAQYAGTSHDAKLGKYVLLQVADTGLGIPPSVRERMFEPFFTTKERGKGTGIGLATVQTVVRSHGGFLVVDSEMGKGSTFKVYIPADPSQMVAEAAIPAPSELRRGKGECVLVVDDEFSIRDITKQTLEAFGYEVITASDGADAVAIYAKHVNEIAVVLTDMMMPVMDGLATIQVLSRMNPGLKVIAASGINSGDSISKASGVGVRHFLLKPYTAETLLKLVREVIDIPDPEVPSAPGELAVSRG